MTEFNGARLASVFAANTDLQAWPHSPPILDCDSNETPNTVFVEHLERIVGKDTTFQV